MLLEIPLWDDVKINASESNKHWQMQVAQIVHKGIFLTLQYLKFFNLITVSETIMGAEETRESKLDLYHL